MSGYGGSDTGELPVTKGADLDDEFASSQQQTDGLERSPTSPSTPALSRRSSATTFLWAGQDQPVPANNVSSEAGQAPNPEDGTYGTAIEEIFRATPPGLEVQDSPSPGHLPQHSPLRLDDECSQTAACGQATACGHATTYGQTTTYG